MLASANRGVIDGRRKGDLFGGIVTTDRWMKLQILADAPATGKTEFMWLVAMTLADDTMRILTMIAGV